MAVVRRCIKLMMLKVRVFLFFIAGLAQRFCTFLVRRITGVRIPQPAPRRLAQPGLERLLWEQNVEGSNPPSPTILNNLSIRRACGEIGSTRYLEVVVLRRGGSSPLRPTNLGKGHLDAHGRVGASLPGQHGPAWANNHIP